MIKTLCITRVTLGLLVALGMTSTLMAAAGAKNDEAILREIRVAEQRNNEEKQRLVNERAKAKDASALKAVELEEQRAKEEDARIAKLKADNAGIIAHAEYMKKLEEQKALQQDPKFQEKAALERAKAAAARREKGAGW
jgi:hypothetical protein